MKAIIVEDQGIVLEDLMKTVRKMGLVAIGFTHQEEAMKFIKKESFDVAFIDISLQNNEDGITLAQDIYRKDNIPIIFISAYDKKKLEQNNAFKNIKYKYIEKPFTEIDIEKAINSIKKHKIPPRG
jgi:two-component SAPR family response regulator